MAAPDHQQRVTHAYFAYGSNMCADQMARRCPGAMRIGVGWVPAYQLVFNRKGSYRPGAVASIVPCDGIDERVYGVIWHLSCDHMSELDGIERAYERVSLTVHTDCGNRHDCHAYIAIPEPDPPLPDPEYLAILLRAAEAAQLPEQYIAQFARFAQ